jgi:hypothetical protein
MRDCRDGIRRAARAPAGAGGWRIVTPTRVAAIVAARAAGTGIRRIARDLGVGMGTVSRLTGEFA